MEWRVVVVGLLAVGAGCAMADSVPETETVTPAPVPTVEETERDPTLPLGVSGGGEIDVDVLASAHREALDNRSYVKYVRKSSHDGRSNKTLHVESPTRYRIEYTEHTTENRVSVFANGSVRYAWDRQYPPHFRRTAAGDVGDSMSADTTWYVRLYLDLSNVTVAETLVDGRLHYRVTAERDQLDDDSTTAGYRLEAVIAPSGLVRTLDVSYVDRTENRLFDVTYSHRYELRPVTVERPNWVEMGWPSVGD